jgi:hypothetical protein
MKSTKQIVFIISVLALIAAYTFSHAQEGGKNEVISQERELSPFSAVDAGGALEVILQTGASQLVKVEAEASLMDKIVTEVKNDVLFITSKDLKLRKDSEDIKVYVTSVTLKALTAHGATDITCESLIEAEEFVLDACGASSVKLNLDVNKLRSKISGASDVILSGRAHEHNIHVSGAGSLSAKSLVTEQANYLVEGASDAFLNVTGNLTGETKGAAEVKYVGDPETSLKTESSGNEKKVSAEGSQPYKDSTKVKIAGVDIGVYEGDDSVKVVVGNRELYVDEDGNVTYERRKNKKFNGHWAGFELGLNGYFTPDYNMSFSKETEYMDLQMTKSWAAHINFFEQNVAFSKNKKWGMVTGLGINWNNYRFSKDTRLNADSSELRGYIDQGISIRRSKLTALYFDIPLLFEFQTNAYENKNSFHVSTGMIMGVRLSSHTKKYYDEWNKEFDVTGYNPATDEYETLYTATSPNYAKAKDFNDFYLNPFKFDATFRIGWGFVNLFANYSVNTLFKKDKGPELYPWTVGITFVNL